MTFDPWATGVLKRKVHQPLVADLERLAHQAGVAPHWIAEPLSAHAGEVELGWARKFRRLGQWRGLAYIGPYIAQGAREDVGDRMAALCGALVRNFVDARVRTIEEVLEEPEARYWTALLLPSFCTEDAAALLPRQRRAVAELVLARAADAMQTVVYAPSYESVVAAYGQPTADVVQRRFLRVRTA